MQVKFLGNEMNLVGNQLKLNDKVNNFKVIDNDLNEVSLENLKGIKVILSVPSIDTPVCDIEVRRFNQEAQNINNVDGIYVISKDLPFAQARWCGASGIDKVHVYSDYKYNSFASSTGTLVNELGLLTRAVFILNANNEVIFVDYLDEITHEPDYNKILDFIKTL